MSSRWQTYPAYKDSGVRWMREVPRHWELRRLKYAAPDSGRKLDRKPDDQPYVGLENIESGTGRVLLDEAQQEVESTVVDFRIGDILFGKLRPYLAKVVHADFDGVGTTELLVLRPREGVHGHFLFYQLLADGFIDTVNSLTYGAKMPRANSEQVRNLPVGLPTLPEQQSIADFLDRETSRIDRLIRKQERLIELLEEKRAALISDAVTKGLDPDVPMTDSGIPWLGAMPAHWDLAPLKHFVAQTADAIKTGPFGSHLLSSEMQGDEVKVYNQRNVIDGDLAGGDKYISEEKYRELEAFSVFPGDILVTTRGTIGQCVTVPEHAELGILHPCLMRISPAPDKLLPDYLIYLIQDSYLVQTQLFLMSNATTIEVIYSNNLRQVLVPRPPSGEQLKIVEELDRETAKLDALISKVETLIGRLQEYRTTLVSAAVTGKIDVREEVPPA